MVTSEPGSTAPLPAPATGARLLRTLAALVIVMAGIKVAAPVVLPVLIAAFLALICGLPARRLTERGLPGWLAITVVLLVLALVVFLASGVVTSSLADFTASLDQYQPRVQALLDGLESHLRSWGVVLDADPLARIFNPTALLQLVASTAQSALGTLGDLVVILLLMAFMLAEQQGLPDKLRRARAASGGDITQYARAVDQVHAYVLVKTWVSLLTGLLAALLLWALGVDYPILWGMIAFFFNFIPNIGSILAAGPPVLLALLQHGWGISIGTAAGYVAINMAIGNVLEPRVMGRRLGLSALVVLLSLIFWDWLLGPVGMLLSVPLTTAVKIWLENTEDGKGIAVLLGPVEGTGAPAP